MTRIITYLVVLFCLARIGDCNLVVSPPPASAASSTSSATTSSAGDNVASSAAPLIIDASLAEFNRREAREKVIAVIEQEWAKKQAERKEAGTDKEAVHRRKALHRRAEIENGRDFISERIERNKELLKEYRKLVYGTSWRGLGNRVYYGIWNAMHETKHAVTNVVGKFRGRTTTEKQDGHSIEAIPIDQAEGVPLELLRDAGAELVRPRQQQQPPLMHTEPPNGKLHARAPKTTKKGFKRTTKKGKKKVTTTKKKQQAGKTTPKKVATTSAKVPFQTPLLLGKPIYLFQSVAGNPIGCDSISCKIVTNRNLATQFQVRGVLWLDTRRTSLLIPFSPSIFQRYCWGAARSTCATGTYLAANDRNGGNCLTRSTTGALILTGCPPQVVFARKARGNIYGRDLDAVEKLGERLERRAMARVVVKDQLFAFREDNKIQVRRERVDRLESNVLTAFRLPSRFPPLDIRLCRTTCALRLRAVYLKRLHVHQLRRLPSPRCSPTLRPQQPSRPRRQQPRSKQRRRRLSKRRFQPRLRLFRFRFSRCRLRLSTWSLQRSITTFPSRPSSRSVWKDYMSFF